MTRRLPGGPYERGNPIQISFEGKPVRAYRSETAAVALYASGHRVLSRSLKYHRPRAFFCLEGHCGGCLMRIDGVPNLRACMQPCRDGLAVEGQNAYPSPDLDVLEAVDWLFPGGMNHHTMMTGSSILNSVVNKIVRQLSGLGELPDHPGAALPATHSEPDVVIIGAGPAGLAAAAAIATAGFRTVLVDEHDSAGGSLLGDPRYGPTVADERARVALDAGAELMLGATAVGYYPEDREPLMAVMTPTGLCRIRARRTVYATGGYARNRLFANNDRPGVLAARAVGRLLVRHRVKPGDKICVIGDDDYARRLADALRDAGSEVIAVDQKDTRVVGVYGRTWVNGVQILGANGKKLRRECDLVAVSALPSPASEGPRQHSCPVEFRPEQGGFAVLADGDGRTAVGDVFACGDVCGFRGPEAAAEMGERTGAAVIASLSGGR